MKIDANSIRIGNVLKHEGRLLLVLKTMHTQPGKGGAYMQVEGRDVKAGNKINVRFRSDEFVEKAQMEQFECQFLYVEGEEVHLMDMSSYEQIAVSKELFGKGVSLLKDGMMVKVEKNDNEIISVTLPETVVVKIESCESVVKGQTAAASYKPALSDNGVRVMVPPFVESGDLVVINTETFEYIERAKS